MNYTLKPLAVGFEVPSLDLQSAKGVKEMVSNISEKLLRNITIISQQCDCRELENGNILFMFLIVLKSDSGLMTVTELENYFKSLSSTISNEMEKFLKLNNIIYKKIPTK